MRAPDQAFADPRLASWYDGLHGDRSDLDLYVALAEEVGAMCVVDVGCGTGSLAVRLAAMGLNVVGVDPADASLDIARAKPFAERVVWVHGDVSALPASGLAADLAVIALPGLPAGAGNGDQRNPGPDTVGTAARWDDHRG